MFFDHGLLLKEFSSSASSSSCFICRCCLLFGAVGFDDVLIFVSD